MARFYMNPYESPKEKSEKKYKPPSTDWFAAIIVFIAFYGFIITAALFLELLL